MRLNPELHHDDSAPRLVLVDNSKDELINCGFFGIALVGLWERLYSMWRQIDRIPDYYKSIPQFQTAYQKATATHHDNCTLIARSSKANSDPQYYD